VKSRRTLLLALAGAALGAALPAQAAGLNAKLKAMVVQPSGPPTRQEFDLTPAANRARAENKWLYVYLGADDCPFCRRYEAFVDQHVDELLPHFGKYLVVDLRSSLSTTADKLYFRLGATSLPYAEFMRSIGDERARLLVYPSVWLFGTDMKPLMQMPAGNGTFQTVPEQIEILRLQQ
jgi:hypothetical protein